MTVTRFDEVTALGAQEQRRILWADDSVGRIWAACALGLSLGSGATPDLRAALDRDLDPGVRRHLVIILAGLGQRSLLESLAANEADEVVRATAAQYAIQTGAASRLRPAIDAIMRDPAAAVRRSLLIANREGDLMLNVSDLAILVGDDE